LIILAKSLRLKNIKGTERMSRLLLVGDLHLGHNNIHRYRTYFKSAEEHHEVLFDNLATMVRKRDTIYFMGDVAFTQEWLDKIKGLRCLHKLLILGNHDTDKKLQVKDYVPVYDKIVSLMSKRNYWFSHCPIHPDEMRRKIGNIHGHTHDYVVQDPRYINVCPEHTDWKPITFEDAIKNDAFGR